jgi:hypothetical protein
MNKYTQTNHTHNTSAVCFSHWRSCMSACLSGAAGGAPPGGGVATRVGGGEGMRRRTRYRHSADESCTAMRTSAERGRRAREGAAAVGPALLCTRSQREAHRRTYSGDAQVRARGASGCLGCHQMVGSYAARCLLCSVHCAHLVEVPRPFPAARAAAREQCGSGTLRSCTCKHREQPNQAVHSVSADGPADIESRSTHAADCFIRLPS